MLDALTVVYEKTLAKVFNTSDVLGCVPVDRDHGVIQLSRKWLSITPAEELFDYRVLESGRVDCLTKLNRFNVGDHGFWLSSEGSLRVVGNRDADTLVVVHGVMAAEAEVVFAILLNNGGSPCIADRPRYVSVLSVKSQEGLLSASPVDEVI